MPEALQVAGSRPARFTLGADCRLPPRNISGWLLRQLDLAAPQGKALRRDLLTDESRADSGFQSLGRGFEAHADPKQLMVVIGAAQ